ncbi:MAG: FG-GAP-like repeat-containing protein [Planctomycetota bacterium]|jgi:hypothetical protein
MRSQILRLLRGSVCALPAIVFASGASAQGPVMLIGDAADDHGAPNVYAGLLAEVLSNASNGQTGILALGVDSGSDAANWIVSVAALLPEPPLIAFVNDETVGAITFSGYAALYIPSNSAYTDGGISATENDFLVARAADVADFLDAGGGLFALTQGQFEGAWGWLGDFAPVATVAVGPSGFCGEEDQFDNVSPSEAGELFGITATNLDGCCWGNVFTSFPDFLAPLAAAGEPACPSLDGQASILTGFVDLPDVNFDEPEVTLAVGEPNVQAVGNLDDDANNTVDVVAVIPDPDPQVAGSIQVFLNQGNDQEGAWLGLLPNDPITVGKNPSGVAVGLFNADGHLDLAVSNANDDTVSILTNQGTGDGSFVVTSTVAVGAAPSSVVASDFNGDAFVDLAVTNLGDDNVVVLFGDGAGNFALAGGGSTMIGFSAGDAPTAMLSDDFDNNDDSDLAGPANGFGGGGLAGDVGIVFVLLGNGDGTFQATAEYAVGVNPTDVAIADLDGDGFADIAASNSADGTVSILINLGDGTFAPAFTIPTGANPVSVDAVDLNGDNDPDLTVVAEDLQIGAAVQVFENRLEGGDNLQFDPPVAFSVNADPNFVGNGDFNNDGLPDLVTVNEDEGASGGSVSVLLNNPPAGPCPGDFDGDGFVNIVDLLVLLGSWGPCEGCPADLNGDGAVNILDFLALLDLWGICAGEGECPWDLNGDGVVDGLDIVELLQNTGPCEDPDCPWDLDGDGFVGLWDLWVLLLHIGDCQ